MENKIELHIDDSFILLEESMSKIQKQLQLDLVAYDLVNPYRERRKQVIKNVLEEHLDVCDLHL